MFVETKSENITHKNQKNKTHKKLKNKNFFMHVALWNERSKHEAQFEFHYRYLL